MSKDISLWMQPDVVQHCRLLADSYFRLTKRELIPLGMEDNEAAFMLYHGSSVIVSHGTEADPVFNFANLKAQQLWELPWEDFVKLPSRLSAEPVERSEREKLLKEASENGYISNYTGIRISSKGKRFFIKNTTLWNVIDQEGNYRGQAAVFSEWEYL